MTVITQEHETMSEHTGTNLFVKTFVGYNQPTITPVGNLREADAMFQKLATSGQVDSVYVYRGPTIIASWDESTQYMMAIGDIEIDEEGMIDGSPYGNHIPVWEEEVQP